MNLTKNKSYVFFWLASTISYFGTYITTLALQVLVVVNLEGSTVDVGWINSSRWSPYVLLGLVAGVIIDRVSRRNILVLTDLGRGILLVAICLLALFDEINVGILMIIMILFGAMSLFNDLCISIYCAPTRAEKVVIARLCTVGAKRDRCGNQRPRAGLLISIVTAPFAILVNATSYLFSGLVMAFIKHQPIPEKASNERILELIKEGLRWVYRHPFLSTLALNTHAWFLFNSMLGTVLVTYALTELGFHASTLGLVMTSAGFGAVIGTTLSTRVSKRFRIGRDITFARLLYAPAVLFMALAPPTDNGDLSIQTFLMIGFGQLFYGLALGIEGPIEMGYRQTITPAHLHGRMNATMRSINRSMIVIGAPLGGFIADVFGFRTALGVVITGLAVVGVWFVFSPMRYAGWMIRRM